jgi:hypothetical protein
MKAVPTMNRVSDVNPRLLAEVLMWRYGIWPLAAVLMGIAAFGIHLYSEVSLKPAMQAPLVSLQQLQAQATHIAHQVSEITLTQQIVQPAPSVQQPLGSVLPSSSTLPMQMDQLVQRSNASGIATNTVQFTPSKGSSASYVGTQAMISLRGNYPQIKQFVDSLWRDNRNASIDTLVLSRQQSDQENIDARLTLTLWAYR